MSTGMLPMILLSHYCRTSMLVFISLISIAVKLTPCCTPATSYRVWELMASRQKHGKHCGSVCKEVRHTILECARLYIMKVMSLQKEASNSDSYVEKNFKAAAPHVATATPDHMAQQLASLLSNTVEVAQGHYENKALIQEQIQDQVKVIDRLEDDISALTKMEEELDAMMLDSIAQVDAELRIAGVPMDLLAV